jgi:hypothetical protein
MSTVYAERVDEAREIERKLSRGAAKLCGPSKFSICWKALFPQNAAAELAARVGCSMRTAEYELSGQQQPSAQSVLALNKEVVPPWK